MCLHLLMCQLPSRWDCGDGASMVSSYGSVRRSRQVLLPVDQGGIRTNGRRMTGREDDVACARSSRIPPPCSVQPGRLKAVREYVKQRSVVVFEDCCDTSSISVLLLDQALQWNGRRENDAYRRISRSLALLSRGPIPRDKVADACV